MLKKILLLVSCALVVGCAHNAPPKIQKVEAPTKTAVVKTAPPKLAAKKPASGPVLSKGEAQARLAAGASLFDARSAAEFEAGHIANAINVPYELLGPTLPALDGYKTKEILLVGKDSQQVEAMRNDMTKAGFKKVFNAASLNS